MIVEAIGEDLREVGLAVAFAESGFAGCGHLGGDLGEVWCAVKKDGEGEG